MTRTVWHSFCDDPDRLLLHASAVEINGSGLLIVGDAGSGKSELALTLMAMGASLISDDRVWVDAENGILNLTAPDPIAGRIEARGVGILRADHVSQPVPLEHCVNLSKLCEDRLPNLHVTTLLGMRLPFIAGKNLSALAPKLLQLMKSGFATHDT